MIVAFVLAVMLAPNRMLPLLALVVSSSTATEMGEGMVRLLSLLMLSVPLLLDKLLTVNPPSCPALLMKMDPGPFVLAVIPVAEVNSGLLSDVPILPVSDLRTRVGLLRVPAF